MMIDDYDKSLISLDTLAENNNALQGGGGWRGGGG